MLQLQSASHDSLGALRGGCGRLDYQLGGKKMYRVQWKHACHVSQQLL